ncbi:competence protein [Sediminibacillus dalangtanensis]|uniref:Competence protein n=1 Tax=Sediminibacillus dalangtanensis TaxID=2729421 RepID=A0ABX7VP33_9BACI|nr:competence protein ComK [Sediminibacillus dalangtanensis]QTM98644.1 competence protein [Sediminibacillus dalangtanensis]
MMYETHYEVTPLTLAVIGGDKGNRFSSRVLEEEEIIQVKQPASKIIDLACKFFGSSLRGRQEGTKDICNITHKVPVSIDPSSGMYFFPTASPNSPQCSWIAHSHIDRISKAANQSTEVIFKNGTSITLPVSHGIILNQIQRTAQFRYLLDHRIKYLWKNNADMVAEPFV